MIIRVTQKLAKKIKFMPETCAPVSPNPFADWAAHVFTAQRIQYVIFTNTASLFSIFAYARGLTDTNEFIRFFKNDVAHEISFAGFKSVVDNFMSDTGPVIISKMTDKRVLGSMNDLINCAKVHLIEQQLSTFETSMLINEMPMSYINHDSPAKAFSKLVPPIINPHLN